MRRSVNVARSINVTPEDLKKSANNVDGKIKEYVNLYNKLYGEVQTMAANWKGEANQAYAKQIEGFKTEFENLKKVLENYVEFLHKSAEVYSRTEANIKDGAGKLTGGR
jgi:WXG100 family type VII secretion target